MDNIEHTVNGSLDLGTIGSRLRAERDRLSLSQEVFASKAGVHRRTQVNYEADERKPDAAYLAVIAEFGVDITYVVTGNRALPDATPLPDESRIYVTLIDTIRAELQLYKGFDTAWQALYDQIKADWADFSKGVATSRHIGLHCRALLSKSPYVEFDPDRLGDLLERIEFVAESEGRSLSARDKAAAALALRAECTGVSPPSLATVKSALQGMGVLREA